MDINSETELYISIASHPGNFGNKFHNELFKQHGINSIYKSCKAESVEQAISGIRGLSIKGCGVSMPFKKAAVPFMDELSQEVEKIGALNTIVHRNGVLKGYNTDYRSVYSCFASKNLSNKLRVGIQGAGGMASAVVCAMKDLKFHDVFIHVRDPKKGENFANQYGVSVRPELSWEDYDILINATPVGMPHTPVQDELPFSQKEIDSAKIVCDCVVAPNGNPLTTLMADLEKPLVSGLELTIRQAVEQSCLYTEISLDFQMALKIAEKALGLDLKYLYDSI